ncbi:Sensor histidine kinase YpdA [Koleobacter methoxysyntrophicus]|uniref:Sensor histidine kinase YpdA n=2 Tax=Koleobacter methoxysyntrophicus TaxID=2751313 RepID=A0A8A0RP70_9FIRM|nr:Sensor histidine kinase YpdA [Koleobacter methoxysyntrophicus]
MIKELLLSLMNRLGMLMMLALFLSRTKLFKRLVTKQNITFQEKLMLTLIFGILGSLGSYFSISFHGALVNTRIIGVAAGGLLGGPLVGFGAGLLAGVHRWFIDIGGSFHLFHHII